MKRRKKQALVIAGLAILVLAIVTIALDARDRYSGGSPLDWLLIQRP